MSTRARKCGAVVIAGAVSLWLSAGAAAREETVDSVLGKVREATGWRRMIERPQGIQLSGKATMAGLDSTYTLIFDAHGHHAQHIDGRISVGGGFDGTRAWVNDIGGERRVLELGDREQAVLGGLISTGGWVAADAPLVLTLDEAAAAEGPAVLKFKVKDGEIAGQVEIDRKAWLPQKWTYEVGGATYSLKFEGVAEFGGMKFPAKVERTGSTGMSMVMTIESAGDAPQFIRSPYEPVLSPPDDITFDAATAAGLEIKKAPTGHLLVHPLVNGKDVGWFIFDTGAGANILEKRAAETLGVEQYGEIPAVGVGGTTMSHVCRPETLTVGPATMLKPQMIVMDLAFLDAHMGVPIAGLVGYGILHRTVAKVDMETPSVELFDPAKFDGAGLKWSKLAVDGRVACVEASFEDHTGYFHLDTGAGASTVTMHTPAVERLKLLEGRDTTPTVNGGVGGLVSAKLGDLAWFEIGGHRMERVAAVFAVQAKGAFANPYTLGSIGGGLVRPFVLVLDYQKGRIAYVAREQKK